MVRVLIPATSANLGPGFDAVGMALSFYNEVCLKPSPKELEIDVWGDGSEIIPKDRNNLVYIAVTKVFESLGKIPRNLKLSLKNRVPFARGLGSSAAAIVGGLVAANAYLGNPLPTDELLRLATELEGHPDNVAPALLGGVVVSGFDRDKVKYLKLPVPEVEVVVAIPKFQLKTVDSRQILPVEIPFSQAVLNVNRVSFLIAAFCLKKYEYLQIGMEDYLHQPYRSQLIPGFYQVMEEAKKAGAYGVALSGSGPTVIAFARESEAVGRAIREAFLNFNVEAEIIYTRPENRGAIDLIMHKGEGDC
ncbi:homoserine kinase [Carboxydothermus pertinax]|uniref:Homoserine kinase n=1 Tax=Carboxydothermus pertinax TaxID=870242 RepID=A0A1L8CTV0_9THEO|nr:homoserine kinase [Carboxydothermus pertinax]GAV22284.1 homoserine kinase [Carboxydothermus pertinax]